MHVFKIKNVEQNFKKHVKNVKKRGKNKRRKKRFFTYITCSKQCRIGLVQK